MNDAVQERAHLARSIARRAGALLMTYYGRLEGYERKRGAIDLVTEADAASEELIVSALREAFPGDAILAEEGSGGAGDSGWTWIVDPLDGTTNFVHGFPIFMVSIAAHRDGEPVIGVCHGPALGELYHAVAGEGAFLGETRLSVSVTPSLAESLVATGFPYNRREIAPQLLAMVERVMMNAHGIRRCGAAAYDQCWLAAGRLDGFFEEGLKPWDTAAGTLIIAEAGGRITNYAGEPYAVDSYTILASNGRIHDELRHTVLQGEGRPA